MTSLMADAGTRAERTGAPWWLHAAAAAFVLLMLLLARTREGTYAALLQEDRLVEWWTFALFLAAGLVFGVRALRERRLGDGGVALFCLAAAGEEISWGQRVLGFTPSATFLEHNAQQEANLHNLVEAFGQPKWTFVAVLAAYGLLLPLLARHGRLALLLERLRVTVVGPALALWFAITIAILVWYPVRFTGEWAEALGGALFLAATPLAPSRLGLVLLLTLAAAAGAERASLRASTRPELVACARAEAAALLADIRGDSLAPVVAGDARIHRRLYSLWRDLSLDSTAARGFRAAACPGAPDPTLRRGYGVDPWGTAYWVRAWTASRRRHLAVYSFGPNRRRDHEEGEAGGGDDVIAGEVRD